MRPFSARTWYLQEQKVYTKCQLKPIKSDYNRYLFIKACILTEFWPPSWFQYHQFFISVGLSGRSLIMEKKKKEYKQFKFNKMFFLTNIKIFYRFTWWNSGLWRLSDNCSLCYSRWYLTLPLRHIPITEKWQLPNSFCSPYPTFLRHLPIMFVLKSLYFFLELF